MATVVVGEFEWDADKAASNVEKHGVSFEEAADALAADTNEVAVEDPSEPGRVHSLVWSIRGRVLTVVTTEAGSRTRIISARKATDDEEHIYQAGA